MASTWTSPKNGMTLIGFSAGKREVKSPEKQHLKRFFDLQKFCDVKWKGQLLFHVTCNNIHVHRNDLYNNRLTN